MLRQDGEVTATGRAKGRVRKEEEWTGVGGGGECLGQIILGRQSISPGSQTHLHAHKHPARAHPSSPHLSFFLIFPSLQNATSLTGSRSKSPFLEVHALNTKLAT